MTPQRVLAATMMLGLCFGMVHEAHAIDRCSAVCRGKNEPCSLKCYLPNHFVTTCSEFGPCVATAKPETTTHKNESPQQKTQQQQQFPEGAKTQ